MMSGGGPSVYARRPFAFIHLRDLADAEDQIGIAPQEQSLEAPYLLPLFLL